MERSTSSPGECGVQGEPTYERVPNELTGDSEPFVTSGIKSLQGIKVTLEII